jgi:GNAT superfamily N-acetyltransferase
LKLEFLETPMDAGDGLRLADAMRAEIALIYDGLDLDAEFMPAGGPAELGPPSGAFLVGYEAVGSEGARALCCGGVKRLDERSCEIKRMYVLPQVRGRGVARALLGALEARARELGYLVARLDTGPRQADPRALYESAGYVEVANFNGNPVASFWGEKPL